MTLTPKQLQEIKDLLSGALYRRYAHELTDGNRTLAQVYHVIGKKLTVSRQDVLDYVAMNGFPESALRLKASREDGTYLIQQPDGRYRYFMQERGTPSHEILFDTYPEALCVIAADYANAYFG